MAQPLGVPEIDLWLNSKRHSQQPSVRPGMFVA
jgi:hypothetical protein